MIISATQEIEIENIFNLDKIKTELKNIKDLPSHQRDAIGGAVAAVHDLISQKNTVLIDKAHDFFKEGGSDDRVSFKIHSQETMSNGNTLFFNYSISFYRGNDGICSVELLEYKFNKDGYRNLVYLSNEKVQEPNERNHGGCHESGLKQILEFPISCHFGVPQNAMEIIEDLNKKLTNSQSR